jgi:hypothetical protein
MFEPPLGRRYPMGASKWRIVAHVLLMPAFKFGNPIQIFIQMKIDYFSHPALYFCLNGFHVPSVWREHRDKRSEKNPVFTGTSLT